MIKNDVEFQATLERIERFRNQVAHLRRVETDPAAYRLSAGNREVREYLSLHPTEMVEEPALAEA